MSAHWILLALGASIFWSKLMISSRPRAQVVDIVVSHHALPRKARFVAALLDTFVAANPQAFASQLSRLAQLPARPPLVAVARQAQQLQEQALTLEMCAVIGAALAAPTLEPGEPGSAREPLGGQKLSRWDSRRASDGGAARSAMLEAFEHLAAELHGAQTPQARCALPPCRLLRSGAQWCWPRPPHSEADHAHACCRVEVLSDSQAALHDVLHSLLADVALPPPARAAIRAVYVRRLYGPTLLALPLPVDAWPDALQWQYDSGLRSGAIPLDSASQVNDLVREGGSASSAQRPAALRRLDEQADAPGACAVARRCARRARLYRRFARRHGACPGAGRPASSERAP